jgi:hypothetical protein
VFQLVLIFIFTVIVIDFLFLSPFGIVISVAATNTGAHILGIAFSFFSFIPGRLRLLRWFLSRTVIPVFWARRVVAACRLSLSGSPFFPQNPSRVSGGGILRQVVADVVVRPHRRAERWKLLSWDINGVLKDNGMAGSLVQHPHQALKRLIAFPRVPR